jgi:hypothetical protein
MFFIRFDGLGRSTPKDRRIFIIIEKIIREKYNMILPVRFSSNKILDSKKTTITYKIIMRKNILKPLLLFLFRERTACSTTTFYLQMYINFCFYTCKNIFTSFFEFIVYFRFIFLENSTKS